jgi:hypothetical protein
MPRPLRNESKSKRRVQTVEEHTQPAIQTDLARSVSIFALRTRALTPHARQKDPKEIKRILLLSAKARFFFFFFGVALPYDALNSPAPVSSPSPPEKNEKIFVESSPKPEMSPVRSSLSPTTEFFDRMSRCAPDYPLSMEDMLKFPFDEPPFSADQGAADDGQHDHRVFAEYL